jgi:hypothetical protein
MTVTAMNAIETTYAGCRFRSRLEARWAVFFDTLGIAWEYEPQGYLVGPEQLPYLPDFWLPDIRLWIEVKGQATPRDLQVLTSAALAPDQGGLPQNSPIDNARNLVVLSNIPKLTRAIPVHMGLGPCPWGVRAHLVAFSAAKSMSPQMPFWPHPFPPSKPDDLTRPRSIDLDGHVWKEVHAAYLAARSARFEHGERG